MLKYHKCEFQECYKMKKSVILEIFRGNRGNAQSMGAPKVTQEYCEGNDEDACIKQMTEEVDFYFAEGFKLGLLIGMECME